MHLRSNPPTYLFLTAYLTAFLLARQLTNCSSVSLSIGSRFDLVYTETEGSGPSATFQILHKLSFKIQVLRFQQIIFSILWKLSCKNMPSVNQKQEIKLRMHLICNPSISSCLSVQLHSFLPACRLSASPYHCS